jgi:3-isopropylmalate/(R)-2-methylmalate dehydratase small subunit
MIIAGKALPLRIDNIDTDQIIAAEHLKTLARKGLGQHAFANLRSVCPALTDARYAGAPILITGKNFGCGSSREHAVWAMLDLGIKAVIAPSFSDIFSGNAFKNALLTVALDEVDVAKLLEFANSHDVSVDLETQIVGSGHTCFSFEFDVFQRECLLAGSDEIHLTLKHEGAIAAYEAKVRRKAF